MLHNVIRGEHGMGRAKSLSQLQATGVTVDGDDATGTG